MQLQVWCADRRRGGIYSVMTQEKKWIMVFTPSLDLLTLWFKASTAGGLLIQNSGVLLIRTLMQSHGNTLASQQDHSFEASRRKLLRGNVRLA